MLLDKGKELFGNTLYTIGDIYEIAYPCNDHDSHKALWEAEYIDLVPGNEVQFIGKVSKREGVFARVRSLSNNVLYDIHYTNLGGLSQCINQEKPKVKPGMSKEKSKRLRIIEKKLAEALKKKKTK